MTAPPGARVAVLVPCHDEATTIGAVVVAMRAALPGAAVYVYDNNSADRTADVARAAGAVVRRESLQGKGHVVRRMFADVEADAYVLLDGDGTYDPAAASGMVDLLFADGLDMVTATRVDAARAAYRAGHRTGNLLLTRLVHSIYGSRVSDLLSGYRVFSRRFVKSFPAISGGFETETEFTIHALDLAMPVDEVEAPYRERPPGSASKLRTVRDGMRILVMIVRLVKEQRPMQFFSAGALGFMLAGVALGAPVVLDYLRTHAVPRLPSAVLATGLVLVSFLSQVCGLVLSSVARGRKECKRGFYLAIPGPGSLSSPVPVPPATTETPP